MPRLDNNFSHPAHHPVFRQFLSSRPHHRKRVAVNPNSRLWMQITSLMLQRPGSLVHKLRRYIQIVNSVISRLRKSKGPVAILLKCTLENELRLGHILKATWGSLAPTGQSDGALAFLMFLLWLSLWLREYRMGRSKRNPYPWIIKIRRTQYIPLADTTNDKSIT